MGNPITRFWNAAENAEYFRAIAGFVFWCALFFLLGSAAVYVGFVDRDPEYLARLKPPFVDSDGNATYWLVSVGWFGAGLIAYVLWNVAGLVIFKLRLRRFVADSTQK